MLLGFFSALRAARVPVSLREHLTLVDALAHGLADDSVDTFYGLARTCLVKDERHLDAFDRTFAACFKGASPLDVALASRDIPEDWLRSLGARYLDDADRAALEALGWDRLMATLRERLREQKERHEGGSKWIGTGGTSPFGADGFHPEGIRIGQQAGRHGRAVKVWEERRYKDLAGDAELGTRTMKLALRRLRHFARSGAAEEFDLDATIRGTAAKGLLDVRFRPERRNAVKLLLLLDIGGSMDGYIEEVEALFAAARAEFKHLRSFYYHNCVYDHVWASNARRSGDRLSTDRLIQTYGSDYRLVFVSDATMAPAEIEIAGGAIDQWNKEPGAAWMRRLTDTYRKVAWINPVPEAVWPVTRSIGLMRQFVGGRMYPLTLGGIDAAARALGG